MSDSLLPPDRYRLEVLRTYLRLQLQAVDDRIAAVEARQSAGYRITQVKPPAETAVLHTESCSIVGGVHISPEEARLALSEDYTELCALCTPGETLHG